MNRAAVMRDAMTRITQMLVNRSIKVTHMGTQAFAKFNNATGALEHVNLPFLPDDASDEAIDATQGFLDHEVGHGLFTDSVALLAAREAGIGNLANVIEDVYVERRMRETFSGSGSNLSTVGRFFLKSYTDKILATGDTPNIRGALIVVALRAVGGQTVFRDYMDDGDKWSLLGIPREKLEQFSPYFSELRSSFDCNDLAQMIREALEPPKAPPQTSPGDGQKDKGDDNDGGDEGRGDKSSADLSDNATERDQSDDKGQSDESPNHNGDVVEDKPKDEPESKSEGEDAEPESKPKDEEPNGDADPDGEEGGDEPGDEEGEEGEGSDGGGQGDDSVPDPDPSSGQAASDADDSEGGGDTAAHEQASLGSAAQTEENNESDGKRARVTELADESVLREIVKGLTNGMDFDDALGEALSKLAQESMRDAEYRVFTQEFDKIEEIDPDEHGVRQSDVDALVGAVDHMVAPMQKDVERAVAARSLAVMTGGHRSGRLHGAALSRMVVNPTEDRVFQRKQENKTKDVAVSLLVDCSGSMGSSRHGKMATAGKTAYALSSVLDRLGIANEVLGFTTTCETPDELNKETAKTGIQYSRVEGIYMPIFKTFDERMGPLVRRRLAVTTSEPRFLANNIDGESVQIAALRLARRRESRKILFVLSDGNPACYGDIPSLYGHLKRVVTDVEKSGIDVVGIGICSDAPKRFYSRHVVLDRIEDLPGEVMRQLKSLLVK